MFFIIDETLREAERKALKKTGHQYVAVLTSEEWQKNKESFEFGIDIEPDLSEIFLTKAEVNVDSLTGTFAIPDRKNPSGEDSKIDHFLTEQNTTYQDDNNQDNKPCNQ